MQVEFILYYIHTHQVLDIVVKLERQASYVRTYNLHTLAHTHTPATNAFQDRRSSSEDVM